MTWLTHRVIRKEASFKLVPNEWFNLETKTGIRGWNSPKFVISVNKYLSTYGAVDARCEIVASTYPTFYLSNVERMGAGSEITVYVIEGNENTINYNLNAGWTDTFRIKENTMYQFEINAGNNWTVAIPENLIGKEFDILYLPKKVYFSKNTFGYEYQATKNADNTISFKLQETKGAMQFETLVTPTNGSYSKNINNCIYFYSTICLNSASGGLANVTINSSLNGSTFSENRSTTSLARYIGSDQFVTIRCSMNFATPRLSTDRYISYSFYPSNFSYYDVSFKSHIKYATTDLSFKEYNDKFSSIVVFIKK